MSIDAKKRYAAAAFVTLLILSVFWPSPVVSSNRLWIGEDLEVDELSFLGREAPSWDVVFWFFAGVLLLAIVQSAPPREVPARLPVPAMRIDRQSFARAAGGLAIGAALTAGVWLTLDAPGMAWAEAVKNEWIADAIRIVNRFGGGMNPALIAGFFLVGGLAYAEPRWVRHAYGMAIAGLTAGIVAQIIKHLTGRARPELWLGPSYSAPGISTSFPSGHTVGAFALAGVLLFSARSRVLRVVALVLAVAVGLSRILAFRHWPSDVTASAVIGLVTAWLVVKAMGEDRMSASSSASAEITR